MERPIALQSAIKIENMNIKHLILRYLPIIGNIYAKYKYGEKRISFGKDNPEKTFYIIGQNDEIGGLWWLINKVLMHLWFAEDKGYIPVIDWLNFKTQYRINRENVWENIFEQPYGYSLEDIKQSKNIIINRQAAAPDNIYYMGQFYDDLERINIFRKLFKKYLRFTRSTLNHLESEYKKYIPEGSRVVGVLCRGTDYVMKKPKTHPIQPEPKQVLSDVNRIMSEYSCDYVFLATEDADIFDLFEKKYGEKLLSVPQKRIHKQDLQKDQFLAKKMTNGTTNQNKMSLALNYLTSTYILSKCNCFISGRTGGCKGVLLMREDFEYCKIYDLGYYE